MVNSFRGTSSKTLSLETYELKRIEPGAASSKILAKIEETLVDVDEIDDNVGIFRYT